MYDVLIIGGGVTGSAIAREMSRYKLNICLLEKEEDVCTGTSKANSAIIHAGYDPEPGTLKARLNVRGNAMFDELCENLDIPFKRNGSLVVAFSEEEMKKVRDLYDRGIKNGVPDMEIIDRERLKKLEPNISDDAIGALYARTAGVICPFTLTIAMAENAAMNGVEFFFNSPVTGIDKHERYFTVHTPDNVFEARYVINAAGLYADEINNMVGGEPFKIRPRKGEYLILDKVEGDVAHTVIFQVPTKMGKGILVTPTVHGNLMLGPTAEDIEDKEFRETTPEGIQKAIEGAMKTTRAFNLRNVITTFTGVRPVPDTEDFIIGESKLVPGFINASGIESPGLTSAPAIAEMVVDIVKEAGLHMEEKPDFNPKRRPVIRFNELTDEEKKEVIKQNPAYGHVICRCETITEGEIIDAIRRPVGARSLDGIKRRTRAQTGRCQAGFCTPRVAEILARELNMTLSDVTKFGGNSKLLLYRVKELLKEDGEKNV
ncbi:MAG: NAD(P)/FAD-dependent oxidoreductase [Thermoanaerobacteraceae bacterium]|jgi:FAD dependent oxidoreductase./BFD-like [2Fe-2S] binding domain.|nr:NAD(P)/FAD-dependent oxidoreductase [Thermoanaerobacteraceae bacterium]